MPQHFVAPPQWEWYIVWYLFLGGLTGAAYALGTLLRLLGDRRDERVARVAFIISFLALIVCPLLLTLDLGRPLRFWHMLIDARSFGPSFKYWSPMSVGAWALLAFGVFSILSFLEAITLEGWVRHPAARGLAGALAGALGRVVMVVGSLLGLFITGYTGVLLSVSNQPIWSDTWALGGLFVASALSVAAAAIGLFARLDDGADRAEAKLARADRYFIVLELVLLATFLVTLGGMAARLFEPRWLALWVLVAAGTLIPLVLYLRSAASRISVLASLLVLVGGFALRMVVVFAAQT